MTPLVAVTGATGFIGQHLLRRLTASGIRVRALTRKPAAQTTAVEWIAGDLANRDALAALVKGATAVVHCAGAIKALGREGFFAVNGEGSRLLAELAAAQATCPRFVHVSSLAARAPHLSAYAASKRAGEEYVQAFAPKLPMVILRPPAVYGPGDPETLRIFKLAAQGFLPAPMVTGARLSLVHADDVVSAILAALEGTPPQPVPLEFDDGKERGYSWAEVAAIAGQVLNTLPRLVSVPAPLLYAAGAVASLGAVLTRRPTVLSWGKVPELLHPDWVATPMAFPGYKPLWTLEKGFADAVSWYRSQGLLTS